MQAKRLLIAVDDPPAIQVVRAELHRYTIAGENTDEIFPHAPGNVSQHLVVVLQLYLEHGIGQRFHHHRHYLNRVFLRQT